MDNSSVAYQVGQIIGAVIGGALVLSIPIVFIIALVKSIRTRNKGWIITAVIFGLPLAAFVGLFIYGMSLGILRARQDAGITAGPQNETPADLATASMSPVTGSVIHYQISYPSLNSWKKQDTSSGPFDQIYNFHDAYVGIIAEGLGVGTPERMSDFSQKNLKDRASQCEFTPTSPIQIDSRSWLTFDATAIVNNIDVKYRYYVYSDRQQSFQILCWSAHSAFDTVKPIFDRVATSFKFPPGGGSTSVASSSHEGIPAGGRNETADLLTASMTPVDGSVIPYQLSFPLLDSWKKNDTSNSSFDQLHNFHDAYVGIIAEGLGMGTPERIVDFSQTNLKKAASQCDITSTSPIQIDSRSWLTYDASATVNNIDIKYRYYVYSDRQYSFQIVCWSAPMAFDDIKPVFDRVATSFKFPKGERPATEASASSEPIAAPQSGN